MEISQINGKFKKEMKTTSMSASSDFKLWKTLLWLWVQIRKMSCVFIHNHSSYLWMFEVSEVKRIIFAENKQADKKFLPKEFFNSAKTKTEFKFWKKILYFGL